MKNVWTAIIGILVVISMTFSWTFNAEAQAKFGKINFAELNRTSVKITAAREELQKMQADAQAKLSALGADIKKLESQVNENKEISSEEKKNLEESLKIKQEEFQTEQQAERIKTTFKQKSFQNALTSQLDQIIAKIAKEEGFSAVFKSDAMYYSAGMIDITDKVQKALDAAPALEPNIR